MVHTVKILALDLARNRITFELGGMAIHARCQVHPHETDLLKPGSEYPVDLTLHAQGKVEYANPGEPGLRVESVDEAGDLLSVLGRTWDSVEMDTIQLECAPTLSVRLNLPQMAPDFRGGSWLAGRGVLHAKLPVEHD